MGILVAGIRALERLCPAGEAAAGEGCLGSVKAAAVLFAWSRSPNPSVVPEQFRDSRVKNWM